MNDNELSKLFTQGSAWFAILKVASRLFASLQIFILARLLTPDDFGLMGTAMLVLSMLQTFSSTGYDVALIQRKEDILKYLDTAWWVELIRGSLLAVLIYLAAPLAAAFFQESQTISILRVLAVYPLLSGLSSPGLIKLNKEMHFRKLVFFQGTLAVISLIISVSFALLLQSVWALVISTLVNAAIYSLGSYLIYPYRPGLNFDPKRAKELWSFGRWVLGNKILHYLFNDGDDWVVGRLLGTQALGFYQTAYNLGNAPSTEITSVFSNVALPVFSKIQDEIERARKAYLRYLQGIMFLSTPVSIGIALVAEDAVQGLLGEKWLPMAASLQILLIWGWVRSFRATTGPVLNAQGRPDLVTKITLVKVFVLAGLIFPFSQRWGIEGSSWAVVIAAIVEIPLLFWSLKTILQISPRALMIRMLRPLFTSILMVLVVLLWQNIFYLHGPVLVRLVVSILLGAVLYLTAGYLLDLRFNWGLSQEVKHTLEYNLKPVLIALRKSSNDHKTSILPNNQ